MSSATDRFAGRGVALFSGLARPESFEALARSIGAAPSVSFRWDDHHPYSRRDIEWMRERAGRGTTFLTTEKDLVKTAHLFGDDAEVHALRIGIDMDGTDRLLSLAESA